MVQRLVRNTKMSTKVKDLHSYACKVCGVVIEIAVGAYAEGAHIRPLGRPHDGPDIESNVLCLCPNDHVRFEFGTILITRTSRSSSTQREQSWVCSVRSVGTRSTWCSWSTTALALT
jgi:predicted restriction endonuclease